MITASAALQNVFKNNSAVRIQSGCTIEYNLNDMVNNITVTNTPTYATIGAYKPFTKLFPASSVVEPNRPQKCGIKYTVLGDSYVSNEFKDPKTTKYDKNFRSYIPGIDTSYKYYLSNRDSALQLNASYPKTIITNKIVVKFELAHSTPTSGSIVLKNGVTTIATINFTNSNIKAFGQIDAGSLTAYYTGSTWSFTESDLNTSSTVSINEVVLSVNAVAGKKHIGVIEISPKLVLDLSSDIEGFDIQTESSSDQSSILPVGNITANSLSLRINKYDPTTLKIINYDKSTTNFQSDRLYMYKNARLKPHFKIYHAAGALGSIDKYDQIEQGIFFINNWKMSENGNLSITALDGAKILQDTICPDILCEQYSGSAIIRTLLDSIGFTNYEFKFNSSNSNEFGIISPRFWWTEDNKTVWEALQEICMDMQMIGVFDNTNTLQFYSRDYVYDSTRSANWTFFYQQNSPSDPLPNIVSVDKMDLPVGNKIRILWQGITTSRYEIDAAPLWKAPFSFLTTAALDKNLLSTDAAGAYISLSPINENGKIEIQNWFYSYSGYILIDSEIIEFDAIEYRYKDESTGTWITQPITSESDILKYRSFAQPGIDNFGPTGRIRIKSRGAFNTIAADHYLDPQNSVSGWTARNVGWF